MSNELRHLLVKYREHGRVSAGEILLPSDLALDFVDDLEHLGVPIWGIDFWRVQEGHVIEIPGGWSSTGSNVAERADDVRRMLIENWPKDAAHASLVFPGYHIDEL